MSDNAKPMGHDEAVDHVYDMMTDCGARGLDSSMIESAITAYLKARDTVLVPRVLDEGLKYVLRSAIIGNAELDWEFDDVAINPKDGGLSKIYAALITEMDRRNGNG